MSVATFARCTTARAALLLALALSCPACDGAPGADGLPGDGRLFGGTVAVSSPYAIVGAPASREAFRFEEPPSG